MVAAWEGRGWAGMARGAWEGVAGAGARAAGAGRSRERFVVCARGSLPRAQWVQARCALLPHQDDPGECVG